MTVKRTRDLRVNAIAKKLAARKRRQRAKEAKPKKRILYRQKMSEKLCEHEFIAYDFETSSIKPGTPTVKYLTAYGKDFWFSGKINSINHLLEILEARFLTDERCGVRYVAWNGNNFDCFFIAAALLHEPRYIIRPYLTRTKSLRGLRVEDRENEERSWEFLDGISMLGMQGVKLKSFLASFAPDYQKLDGPDFATEEFCAENHSHVQYAERDSIGLYYGLLKAQSIIVEHFQIGFRPTIGNMGIRIFKSHIPHGVAIHSLPARAEKIIREYAMRGGYCFCVRKYEGPVWKYDINQAYAAAMRETWLPAGVCHHTRGLPRIGICYVARIDAINLLNRIPFYTRDTKTGKSGFDTTKIKNAWLTSIEIRQLQGEGWKVKCYESYYWDNEFTMKEYVDKLENLRVNAPGGPKSPQGQIMKYIGNNSYGKTVEHLDGLELIMANEQPEGYYEYYQDEEALQHVWFRFGDPEDRDYHQPHIGAFITAHVRMVLRRAILLSPKTWLYADTDCIVFSSPLKGLDTNPSRYGAWKIESEGENFRIITKKVYANFDASEKHAKGININRLNADDFVKWFNNEPPVQTQVQRQNFVRVMTGFDMFIERTKTGQRIKKDL